MQNHSYENEFNLRVNEISFSYEWLCTKTRFEKESLKGNSEMAYRIHSINVQPTIPWLFDWKVNGCNKIKFR